MIRRYLPLIFFALTLIASCFIIYHRIDWIFTHRYPPSSNAYFYLVEIRSWMRGEGGYYGKLSLFFPLAGFLANTFSLTDHDIFRFFILFSLFCFSVSLMLLGYHRSRWWLLPFLCALPWLSDLVFFRHNAFLKQATSWSLFFLGFSILVRTESIKGGVGKICAVMPGALLVVLGGTMHLFTIVVGSALCFSYFIRNNRLLMTSLLIVIFFAAFAASYTGKELFQFFPWHFRAEWRALFRDNAEYFLALELILAALLFGFLLFYKSPRDRLLVLLLGIVAVFLLPIWSKESSLSLRLFMSSFWIFYPAVARAISLNSLPKIVAPYAVVLLLGSIYLPHERFGLHGMADGLFPQYQHELASWIKKGSFVRAPMGVQFAVTYHLGLPSSDNPPRDDDYPAYYKIRRYFSFDRHCHPLKRGSSTPFDATCVRIGESWVVQQLPHGVGRSR